MTRPSDPGPDAWRAGAPGGGAGATPGGWAGNVPGGWGGSQPGWTGPGYNPPQPPPQPPPMPYAGAPGYPGAAYPVPPGSVRSTSGWAIAAVVLGALGFAAVTVPPAIGCGVVGLVRTRYGAQRGRGLAIAGLVLAGLWSIALVVGLAVLVALPGDTAATDLAVGDCLSEIPTADRVTSLPTVDCATPHSGEVFAVLTVAPGPAGSYPGAGPLKAVEDQCPGRLAAYAPAAAADQSIGVFVLYPTEQTWARGDDVVTCIALLDPRRSGSLHR